MEIIDEHGELCAFCSDDPQDFIHIPPVEAIRLLTRTMIDFWLFTKKPRKTATIKQPKHSNYWLSISGCQSTTNGKKRRTIRKSELFLGGSENNNYLCNQELKRRCISYLGLKNSFFLQKQSNKHSKIFTKLYRHEKRRKRIPQEGRKTRL